MVIMFKKICVMMMFLSSMMSVYAASYEDKVVSFTQPNGEELELRVVGNQYYARTQSLDGYTLIFNSVEQAYYYAELSVDGHNLVSTGILTSKELPLGVQLAKNLRISHESQVEKTKQRYDEFEQGIQQEKRWKQFKQTSQAFREYKELKSSGFHVDAAPPSDPPTLGDLVGLTILVDFSDEEARSDVTQQNIDDFCNKEGGKWSNNGSVYDYFYKQSNGRLRYTNNVTYYVRVPNTFSYYNNTTTKSMGENGSNLLLDAITQLKEDGYDFSGLTTNASGNVIATNLFWAGNTSGVWAEGLWPHRSAVSPVDVGGGVAISDYQMTNIGTSGSPTIGTFCHEDGHMIGQYVDYYDYGGDSSGVGHHCLMASGNYASSTNPANISGYLKYHSGWVDAVDLNAVTGPVRFSADVDGTKIYKYTNPDNTDEYFLIENRSKVGGWEAGGTKPDSGMMISHIDEGVSTDPVDGGYNSSEDMTEALHYEHSIEQADNTFDLENDRDSGDDYDLFHSGGTGENNSFTDTTSPNAKWWAGATGDGASGTASGLYIHDISEAGSTMTFVYGAGTPSGTASVGLSTSILENACDFQTTADTQTFAISNTGGGTLNYAISDDVSWLSCSVSSGSATTEADTITVSYSTAALSSGTYNGIITVSGGATETIEVTLEVRAAAVLELSTSVMDLSIQPGESTSDSFNISNSGEGTLSYSLSSDQPWMSFTSSSGTVISESDMVTVNFDTASLAAGDYSATITATSSVGTETIAVSLYVGYTLTYITSSKGTISGVLSQQISIGGDGATVTAEANIGYDFMGWTDGVMTPSRTDTNINANLTVTANFGLAGISAFPHTESFEGDFGSWVQGETNDFDWKIQSGATSNYNDYGMGPESTEYGSYHLMAPKGNSGVSGSEEGHLVNTFDFSNYSSLNLDFYYHMWDASYGSIGTIKLDVSIDSGNTWVNEWSKTGSQASAWINENINLDSYAGKNFVMIRFTSVASGTNAGFGHMSIDNLSLTGVSTGNVLTVVNGSGSGTYSADESVAIVADAAPTNQHFSNWSTSDGGSFGDANSTSTNYVMPANSATVTANYELDTYTVTFDLGTGILSSGDLVQTIDHGSGAVEPTLTPATGYSFSSWDVAFSNITSDLTVTAQYTINSYTVTFDLDGKATSADDLVQSVEYGSTAVAPSLSLISGNVFSGWDVAFNNITSDITVTALYNAVTYTVIFDLDSKGTSSDSLSQTIAHGAEASAPNVTPSNGWDFTGWDQDFSVITGDLTVTARYSVSAYTVNFDLGAGTLVSGSLSQAINHGSGAVAPTLTPATGYSFSSWDVSFSNITSDLTVTAQYAINTYTVTFDLGVGSLVSGSLIQTIDYGSGAVAPVLMPATGYSFSSWDVAFSNITSDLTVRAQYELNTYTVTFDLGAGTLVSGSLSQVINHGSGAVAPTLTPATGYSFSAWDVAFSNITSDLTVTAQYDINTYTVTFDLGAGALVSGSLSQTIDYGSAAVAPTLTPVTGYSFSAWDVDFSNITSDLTVTAQYAINTYTVTFDIGAGSLAGGSLVQSVDYGSMAIEPGVTPADGYILTSWDVDFSNITSDITVTAVYHQSSYNVIFDLGDKATSADDVVQIIDYGTMAIAPNLTMITGWDFVAWDESFDVITSDLTVRAIYTKEIYTVTFVTGINGSTNDALVQQVAFEESASAPTISADTSWIFTGWNRDFNSITGDTTIYANYSRVETEGDIADVVNDLDQRVVTVTPDEDYLIETIAINGSSEDLEDRDDYESDPLAEDDEVLVTYVKRIESVLVYKGSDKGLEIGEGLSTKVKDTYYLLLSFDQFGSLYKSKLIKYWRDVSKVKQKSELELNLSGLDTRGKTSWKSFAQLDEAEVPISLLTGKSKLLSFGFDENNFRISKEVASSLKGSVLIAGEEDFTSLKRTWKLDKATTKDANSFLPKKFSQSDATELPKIGDVVDYLINEKLLSYELLED